jgi:hypothetical protein
MKKNKDVQFCLDELQSLQKRDGLDPGQRSALENAKNALKELRRIPHPNRGEIFKVVRKVAEAIIKNFVGKCSLML